MGGGNLRVALLYKQSFSELPFSGGNAIENGDQFGPSAALQSVITNQLTSLCQKCFFLVCDLRLFNSFQEHFTVPFIIKNQTLHFKRDKFINGSSTRLFLIILKMMEAKKVCEVCKDGTGAPNPWIHSYIYDHTEPTLCSTKSFSFSIYSRSMMSSNH